MLTVAGREFIRYANQIVKNYDNMMKSMDKYNHMERKTLRLGAIPVIGRLSIMSMLADFHKQIRNDASMILFDRPTTEIIEMIKNQTVDVGIVALDPFFDDDELSIFPIQENNMVLLVDHMHRLSGRKSVEFREIENDTFIIPDERTGMFRLCTEAAADAGFKIKRAITCRNIDMMMAMVSVGNGVGLASQRLAESYKANNMIDIIKLENDISYNVSIVSSQYRDKKEIVNRFINFALQYNYDINI